MSSEPWFSGNSKPTRIGDYEVRFSAPKVTVAKWDGRVWRHHVLPPIGHRGEFFWRAIPGLAARRVK